MESLILVTLLLFCGNGEPIRVMKFVMPHAIEQNEQDQSILDAIKSKKEFSFLNHMAKIEKVEHMVNWKEIGEEIK